MPTEMSCDMFILVTSSFILVRYKLFTNVLSLSRNLFNHTYIIWIDIFTFVLKTRLSCVDIVSDTSNRQAKVNSRKNVLIYEQGWNMVLYRRALKPRWSATVIGMVSRKAQFDSRYVGITFSYPETWSSSAIWIYQFAAEGCRVDSNRN
jgi:hypothetical protein